MAGQPTTLRVEHALIEPPASQELRLSLYPQLQALERRLRAVGRVVTARGARHGRGVDVVGQPRDHHGEGRARRRGRRVLRRARERAAGRTRGRASSGSPIFDIDAVAVTGMHPRIDAATIRAQAKKYVNVSPGRAAAPPCN